MSTTLGDIATKAMNKMNRSDLAGAAVEAAGDFYMVLTTGVPFDALMTTSAEIPTVAGTASYSLAAYNIVALQSIRMTYSSSPVNRMRMKRKNRRYFDNAAYSQNGKPVQYSRYGGALELFPTPDSSAYTFRLSYWSRPTLPTSPTELGAFELVTPPEWDELCVWETLYRLYICTEQHDKAALLVQPMPMPRQPSTKRTPMFEYAIIPRLWNDLLKTVDQREAWDEDFGINPVVRRYTHG